MVSLNESDNTLPDPASVFATKDVVTDLLFWSRRLHNASHKALFMSRSTRIKEMPLVKKSSSVTYRFYAGSRL